MVGRKRQAADCPAAVTEQAWGVVLLDLPGACEWEWDGDLMTLAAGAMGWIGAAEAGSDRRQRWHGGLSLNRGQTQVSQGYPPCLLRLDASYAPEARLTGKIDLI